MPINILMPALSPTMEKGNLAKWLKKEGDKVKSGDVIAEIETDKATMEVEAVDEGTIAKILVPEGTQDVPVNDVIAVLAGDGEDVKAAGAGAGAPPKAAEAPAAKPAAAPPPLAAAAAPKTKGAPAPPPPPAPAPGGAALTCGYVDRLRWGTPGGIPPSGPPPRDRWTGLWEVRPCRCLFSHANDPRKGVTHCE